MPISNVIDGKEGGDILYGQLNVPELGLVQKYTQRMENCDPQGSPVASYGDPNAEITPNDSNSSEVKTFLNDEFEQDVLGIFVAYPSYTQLDLPDELLSIFIRFSKSKGIGSDSNPGAGGSLGTSYSLALSVSARANSSLSITADLQINRRQHPKTKIASKECYFYVKGNTEMSDILTRLTTELGDTVLALPLFFPEAHTVIINGESATLSANAGAQQSVSHSGANDTLTYGVASGSSVETGLTVKTVELPFMIHKELNLQNTFSTDTITATAAAAIASGTNWPARGSGSTAPTQTVTATVFPNKFEATEPPSVPTTGLYLTDIRVQFFQNDLFRVFAEVVDFSLLLTPPKDLLYTVQNAEYTTGVAIEPNRPTYNGGDPVSYAVTSGTLSPGLSLNTTTGVITGTPTTPVTSAISITATNSKGSSIGTLSIHVI